MTKKGKNKICFSVYLPEGLLAFIDGKVGELFSSRSDYVADLLRREIAKEKQENESNYQRL